MRIISGILILISAFLSIKHGWDGLNMYVKPGEPNMMEELGIGKTAGLIISIFSLAAGLLILFPQTFFIGNLINAGLILIIMALALKTGNTKTALMEIPFLLLPLIMIWLGHPFKK